MQYCMSYSRTVFRRYGYFNEDLREGEECEFHQRFENKLHIQSCRGLLSRHHHTARLRALVNDQYVRGRRAVTELREAGRYVPARCHWRISLRKLSTLLKHRWAAAHGRERIRIGLAAPLIASGAIAYCAGARVRNQPQIDLAIQSADTDNGVYALLQVRNGMRYLPGYLENLQGNVKGVIALDDGSSDGTREYLQKSKLVCTLLSNSAIVPHQWNEVDNRKRLIDAALRLGATWVIAVDVDERLPGNFSIRLRSTLKRARIEGIDAFAVWLRELWDQPERYRVDGVWGSKRVARLFNVQQGKQCDDRKLHGQWASPNSKQSGKYIQADLEIFHLNMIRHQDRLRRRLKYEMLDPDRRWQAVGYEHLTDERGCVCRSINHKSMYQPAANGPEMNPQPPRILALLAFHNETRFLVEYLRNVAPQVDGIVALDDGSTDGSAEIIRHHPKVLELLSNPISSPHEWNETTNQRRLLEAVSHHDPGWILVVDADERVEKYFRDRANAIIWLAESRGVSALSLALRELWGSRDTYRSDGVWGEKRKANLFKYRRDHEFDERQMHNYWAPLNSRVNGQYCHADLEMYHLRMIEPQDREARRRRYERLDPTLTWQPNGYDYLVDETSIELTALNAERHFL